MFAILFLYQIIIKCVIIIKDARLMKLVNIHDSKSCAERLVGSTPTSGTIICLIDSLWLSFFIRLTIIIPNPCSFIYHKQSPFNTNFRWGYLLQLWQLLRIPYFFNFFKYILRWCISPSLYTF